MSHPHGALRGEARGDVFAVHFDGQELHLDAAQAPAFAAALSGLLQQSSPPEVRVDLGNVTALSTPALVALVKLRRQLLARGRRLVLCNLRPAVAEVLEVSKLSRLFPIHREETSHPTPAAVADVRVAGRLGGELMAGVPWTR
jgi:anti-anti-sigma factor